MGSNATKTKRTTRRPAWLRDLTTTGAFLGVALLTRSSLADHYVVPTESMEPTVVAGDRVFVDKAAYGVRLPVIGRLSDTAPQRGDVAVLTEPGTGKTLLKRVVALPGDRIRVESGRLWLNGSPITTDEDSHLVEHWAREDARIAATRGGGADFGPATVPADSYLVLGDNRGNSKDGRSFGFVRADALLGRAVAVYYRDGFRWITL